MLGAAERDPDREAIAFPDHSLTYRDFADYSRNIARSMLANGIRSGDHVGILATNRPEFLPILFARNTICLLKLCRLADVENNPVS